MARTKAGAAPRRPTRLVTLTRFFLPLEQEWPSWEKAEPDDAGYPPLINVKGFLIVERMGRLIDDPQQAVYILEWDLMENFKNFLSSTVCADFLSYLPEAQESVAARLPPNDQMGQLSLDDQSSPAARFLVGQYIDPAHFSLEGVVTLTSFSISGQFGGSTFAQQFQLLKDRYESDMPDGPLVSSIYRNAWEEYQWFRVIDEDHWALAKFGGRQMTDADSRRTLVTHAALWSLFYEELLLQENATVADEGARAARAEAMAMAMPPATAAVQERWHIRRVRFPKSPDHSGSEEKAIEVGAESESADA